MKKGFVLLALVLGLVLGLSISVSRIAQDWFGGAPDPETIASASLESMRAQNRLVPFTASYVGTVTSQQRRLGIVARKTMILPGTVRYELDLARLGPQSVKWDAATRTLGVELPPLELAGPQFDLTRLREYSDGGLALAFTGGEAAIDDANRANIARDVVRQARAPAMMRIAHDAAKSAVERSFALPLAAAGIDARVVARFGFEGTRDGSRMDASRRVEDVLRERQRARAAPATPPPSS